MILTYRYRLKDKHARRLLLKHAWSVNQVWNYCVETQRKVQTIWKSGLKIFWPTHYSFIELTKGTSNFFNLNAQTLQEICHQFVKGRDSHRKVPKFRSSQGPKRSLGWIPFQTQSRQLVGDNGVKYLGKVYKFFGAKKRPLPENGVKGGCFVEDARGNWYVCFQVEIKEDNNHGVGKVGIDLGLKHLATCSDGIKFEAPQYYRKLEQKLRVAQRSKNKAKIKSINSKIKNQRQDYLHKLSNKLVKENELIVVGNVSAAKLAKTKMAKSVLDAGWAMLRSMLRYKASRHGALYREVDEKFTSQACSHCGCLPSSQPKGIAGLGIREWRCSKCGTNHDRDINAAKNILSLGLSAQPLAEES